MKRTALIVLLLAAGVGGPRNNAVAAPPDAEAADYKAIQGQWKCVETIEGGKTYETPEIIWVFANDRVTVALEGRTQHTGTFMLKPSSNPAAIDMQLKGETAANSDADIVGIYKLQKDKLIVCAGVKDAKDKRPTTFIYNEDSPTSSLILERVSE